MKLILMRHSSCVGLDKDIINGWLDFPLTKAGINEAKRKAKCIQEFDIDLVYTSFLSRSYDTAKYILEAANKNIDIIQDIRLNERHYGAFQGMERKKAYEFPEYNTLSKDANRLDNRLIPMADEDYEKQIEDYAKRLNVSKENLNLPKAESVLDVEARIIDFLKEKIFISGNENKTIVIVGHANTVKLTVKYLENLTYEQTSKLRFATCGMNIYDLNYTNNKIEILNCEKINEEWQG